MPKFKDPNVWFQYALKVTEDPAASSWLKNALLQAFNRDPVDAAGDAEVLSRILRLRSSAVQKAVLPARRASRRRDLERRELLHSPPLCPYPSQWSTVIVGRSRTRAPLARRRNFAPPKLNCRP